MNFLKKMLGLEQDLATRVAQFKAKGTLFEVAGTTRNIKLQTCTITFSGGDGAEQWAVEFHGEKEEEFVLPVHLNMNAVCFSISKAGRQFACFEWQLEGEAEHVGCYMEPESRKEFREILCLVLKRLSKDEHIKDPLSFCPELAGIPVYRADLKASKNVSSGISSSEKEQLNDLLIQEAQKPENKMVHTCSYFQVELRERRPVLDTAIFVLKAFPDYQYEFQIINAAGFTVLKKPVDAGLNYEVNVEKGYVRWIDVDHDCRIIEANFDAKRDAALSLKYNMFEVMYELRSKRRVAEDVPAEELAYMKKIEEPRVEEVMKSKVVAVYQDRETIEEIGPQNFLYLDEEMREGSAYGSFSQAKIADFSIAALGSLMETLSISQDSHIKPNDKRRLLDRDGKEVTIADLLLHDADSKAFIRGADGRLYYQDLVKGKHIEQYDPSPKKGVVSICPEFKLAETAEFRTFKAVSENTIFEMDPRTKEGVGSLKEYSGNPQFTTVSVSGSGCFATGARTGEIRFFKQIGKNANNKFTSSGDAVLHLDTTKDGRWVLATFRRYLRLIPTENDDELSLFDRKIPLPDRPTPIKLEISLEDLQQYGVRDFCLLPAKFDESRESIERFIISGFGEFTVVWNLGRAVKGDRSYLISRGEGKVAQADFRFNDPSKLIMATSQGILLKENKIRK